MLSFPVFAKLQSAFQSRANSFPLTLRFRRPFFSCTYKLPLAQPLSFDIHANWWGVVGVSPIKNLECYLKFSFSGCALPSLSSLFAQRAFDKPSAIKRIRTLLKNSRVVLVSLNRFSKQKLEVSSHSGNRSLRTYLVLRGTTQWVTLLCPLFSYSCALFCTHQKLNSFIFSRFCTLWQKRPGWGEGGTADQPSLPSVRSVPPWQASFHRLPSEKEIFQTQSVPNRTDDCTLPHVYSPCAILPSPRPGDRPFLPRWRSS
jgi:hypothetical protein